MNYICDCMGNKKSDKRRLEQGLGTFSNTAVHLDGTCKHCGHYAVQFKTLGYNRGKPSVFASLSLLYGVAAVNTKRLLVDPLYTGNKYEDVHAI